MKLLRMTRKKVLFLIESLSGGGAEKVLVTLIKHLDKKRFDVTLCCVSNIGSYIDEIRSYVDYHYILPNPSKLSGLSLLLYKIKHHLIYFWLPASWVYRLFIPEGNDVEVAFTEGFVTRLISFSTNNDSKKIAWVHIDLESNPWTQRKGIFRDLDEESACYSRFDRIACVSESVAEAFRKIYEPSVPVSVLYNPVDYETIQSKSKEPASLPAKTRFRIVSVGRLAPQKAFGRLVRIAGRLIKEGFDFDLWILGEGEQRDYLQQLTRDEGLDNVVSFWGYKDNPYPYLVASDLFACSSLAEGYSTAATEALIIGLPVITTDCAGMRELFGCDECGLITENNEDSLYESIKTALSDKALYDKFKLNAVKRAKDFSLFSTIEPIQNFLEEC